MNGIEHYRSGLSICQFRKGFRSLLNLEQNDDKLKALHFQENLCTHFRGLDFAGDF